MGSAERIQGQGGWRHQAANEIRMPPGQIAAKPTSNRLSFAREQKFEPNAMFQSLFSNCGRLPGEIFGLNLELIHQAFELRG